MSDTVLLNRASDTPSGRTPSTWGSLPPELLDEGAQRLGWAGLIYSATYTLAYFGPHVVSALTIPGHTFLQVENVFAGVSIAVGLLVFVLSRRTKGAACQRFLDFGLAFAVFGAFGISLVEFWHGFPERPETEQYLGIPWECVWIIMFPVIAPNAPGKMLITSLLSASTGPIVLALAAMLGGAPVSVSGLNLAVYFLFTTYLSAVVAYFMARVIYRYGIRLKKAQEIGSYELVEAMGEGGMGEVWIARHRMLARPSAIKLIRPELLGADQASRTTALRRFEREARATAALRSTHTVDVYDFGLTADGAFFYVMELLEGVSLETLVKRFGPVSPARAIFLLKQACESLAEAHERGLIHRDVKPANIFACRLGPEFDFVKVLDFGLVKEGPGHDRATELTAEGITAGTPAFMAPEMAMATPDVDGRADIYALGCVAYWLVTGLHVFDGPTPIATILEHVRSEPLPPSRRTEIAIPAAFDDVVMACLAKDPADRPQSAVELAAILSTCLQDDLWRPADAEYWWLRHRPVAGLPGEIMSQATPAAVLQATR